MIHGVSGIATVSTDATVARYNGSCREGNATTAGYVDKPPKSHDAGQVEVHILGVHDGIAGKYRVCRFVQHEQ
jgi:hypothetical protein